jgi:hypothetical protein
MATKHEWHKVSWLLMNRALSRALILIIFITSHSKTTLKPCKNISFMSYVLCFPISHGCHKHNTFHIIGVLRTQKRD